MATYLILNSAVLLAIGLVAYRFRKLYAKKEVLTGLAILLLLTLVFDNLIIANNIVAYDESLISGIKAFVAPIEDFAYAITAVLLMPLLWKVVSRD